MLELVKAGGWLMLPIIACSVIALAIIGERLWMLRMRRVVPRHLVAQVWTWIRDQQLDNVHIHSLRTGSPMGRVLAAGLVNRHHDRDVMLEAIQDTGRHAALELERYLNSLGTIAAITPLLGLLGTVIGMIKVFSVITTQGVGDPGVLAGGISEALITTAAGLTVAIPSLMFYRYFRGKVDMLVVRMEEESMKLVEVMQGEREADIEGGEAA
ncbi:biopolymer transporter ExbB [Thiohalobacter sp. COW1]|uniref:Biopolymer transport proteins n=1 Tax=Thiohalobacter thiocyanaticus TaxID=585455 RepID=A0A1Z4VSL5_9GAMM|nr:MULTISPECIES: MotA/TolQ/ExbB proton channel family protein [Thiohalobacter]BAZ94194.1 biopolymer transport proteins [Thiohalobacter thiocyanaticus]BCO30742.1 biopolymer transporter ExbB [Thiohalobacter sp. COW1]